MFNDVACTDYARVLAELIDTALADDWNEDAPTMALLWQASPTPTTYAWPSSTSTAAWKRN
jgi:hypothetical protein